MAVGPGFSGEAAAQVTLDLTPLGAVLTGDKGCDLALAAHAAGPADSMGE